MEQNKKFFSCFGIPQLVGKTHVNIFSLTFYFRLFAAKYLKLCDECIVPSVLQCYRSWSAFQSYPTNFYILIIWYRFLDQLWFAKCNLNIHSCLVVIFELDFFLARLRNRCIIFWPRIDFRIKLSLIVKIGDKVLIPGRSSSLGWPQGLRNLRTWWLPEWNGQ